MEWAASEISSNVHLIEVAIPRKVGNGMEILVQSDQHIDNDKCDREMMKRHLDEAKEKGCPIISLGDLFCAMGGRNDKRSSAASTKNYADRDDYFDAVVEDAVDFYRDYAKQMVVFGRGNHETSVVKKTQTDLLARWAYRLKAETGHGPAIGGYGGWLLVKFTDSEGVWKRTLRIKYYHGSGGGGIVTRGTLGTRKGLWTPDASVVLTGHIHEDWSMIISRERISNHGAIYIDEQLHAQCPTYKEEYGSGASGWHIETGKPPKPIGALWLGIYYDKRKGNHKGFEYSLRADVTRAR